MLVFANDIVRSSGADLASVHDGIVEERCLDFRPVAHPYDFPSEKATAIAHGSTAAPAHYSHLAHRFRARDWLHVDLTSAKEIRRAVLGIIARGSARAWYAALSSKERRSWDFFPV